MMFELFLNPFLNPNFFGEQRRVWEGGREVPGAHEDDADKLVQGPDAAPPPPEDPEEAVADSGQAAQDKIDSFQSYIDSSELGDEEKGQATEALSALTAQLTAVREAARADLTSITKYIDQKLETLAATLETDLSTILRETVDDGAVDGGREPLAETSTSTTTEALANRNHTIQVFKQGENYYAVDVDVPRGVFTMQLDGTCSSLPNETHQFLTQITSDGGKLIAIASPTKGVTTSQGVDVSEEEQALIASLHHKSEVSPGTQSPPETTSLEVVKRELSEVARDLRANPHALTKERDELINRYAQLLRDNVSLLGEGITISEETPNDLIIALYENGFTSMRPDLADGGIEQPWIITLNSDVYKFGSVEGQVYYARGENNNMWRKVDGPSNETYLLHEGNLIPTHLDHFSFEDGSRITVFVTTKEFGDEGALLVDRSGNPFPQNEGWYQVGEHSFRYKDGAFVSKEDVPTGTTPPPVETVPTAPTGLLEGSIDTSDPQNNIISRVLMNQVKGADKADLRQIIAGHYGVTPYNATADTTGLNLMGKIFPRSGDYLIASDAQGVDDLDHPQNGDRVVINPETGVISVIRGDGEPIVDRSEPEPEQPAAPRSAEEPVDGEAQLREQIEGPLREATEQAVLHYLAVQGAINYLRITGDITEDTESNADYIAFTGGTRGDQLLTDYFELSILEEGTTDEVQGQARILKEDVDAMHGKLVTLGHGEKVAEWMSANKDKLRTELEGRVGRAETAAHGKAALLAGPAPIVDPDFEFDAGVEIEPPAEDDGGPLPDVDERDSLKALDDIQPAPSSPENLREVETGSQLAAYIRDNYPEAEILVTPTIEPSYDGNKAVRKVTITWMMRGRGETDEHPYVTTGIASRNNVGKAHLEALQTAMTNLDATYNARKEADRSALTNSPTLKGYDGLRMDLQRLNDAYDVNLGFSTPEEVTLEGERRGVKVSAHLSFYLMGHRISVDAVGQGPTLKKAKQEAINTIRQGKLEEAIESTDGFLDTESAVRMFRQEYADHSFIEDTTGDMREVMAERAEEAARQERMIFGGTFERQTPQMLMEMVAGMNPPEARARLQEYTKNFIQACAEDPTYAPGQPLQFDYVTMDDAGNLFVVPCVFNGGQITMGSGEQQITETMTYHTHHGETFQERPVRDFNLFTDHPRGGRDDPALQRASGSARYASNLAETYKTPTDPNQAQFVFHEERIVFEGRSGPDRERIGAYNQQVGMNVEGAYDLVEGLFQRTQQSNGTQTTEFDLANGHRRPLNNTTSLIEGHQVGVVGLSGHTSGVRFTPQATLSS